MENPVPLSPQATLAALQQELASRTSVVHFAHASVATILALIAAGTTSKLVWDLDLSPKGIVFVWPVAGFSSLCFLYGLVRYLYGRRVLKKELASFAQLQALRRELNQDDPSTLLPR